MSYLGRSAKLSLKAQEKVSFLATAGQTSKTGLSYTPSFIEVYVNGVLLTDTTDYTATNGNSVTFTVALLLNDEVTVISLKTFTVADHYNKTEADTLLAAKATVANFTSTGIDDNATSTAVTIDASENVGIGTASPSARFEVEDNGSATGGVIMKVTQDDQGSHYGMSVGNDAYSTVDTDGFVVYQMNNGHTYLYNGGVDEGPNIGMPVSGGITFGTDTAAANTLDDYETGSWTPSVTGTTGGTVTSYHNRAGRYIKIGNQVTLWFYFHTQSVSGMSGTAEIAGLPFSFTSDLANNAGMGTVSAYYLNDSSLRDITLVRAVGGKIGLLGSLSSNGITGNAGWGNVAATAFSGTALQGVFTYRSS